MSQDPGPGFVPATASNEPYGFPPQQVPNAPSGAPVHTAWASPQYQASPPYKAPPPQAWPASYGYAAPSPQLYGQPVSVYPVSSGMAACGFVPVPAAPKQPMLGIVALSIVGVGLAVLCYFMLTLGTMSGQLAPDGNLSDQQTDAILGHVGLGILLSCLVVFAGWVVGIVATAINRGRAYGIVSIVLGVLTPLIAFSLGVVGVIASS